MWVRLPRRGPSDPSVDTDPACDYWPLPFLSHPISKLRLEMPDLSFLSSVAFFLPDIASIISAVANVLAASAWPAVVFCLVMKFREPIGRFIDRIKRLNWRSLQLEATRQQTPKGIDAAAESFDAKPLLFKKSPVASEKRLFHEAMSLIQKELSFIQDYLSFVQEDRSLQRAIDWDEQEYLKMKLAGTVVSLYFEGIQRHIFASQVNALNLLNEQPISKAILKSHFYDPAVIRFPGLHKNRSFEEWIGYLTGQRLVDEMEDEIEISSDGQEFLDWRLKNRRAGPYHG